MKSLLLLLAIGVMQPLGPDGGEAAPAPVAQEAPAPPAAPVEFRVDGPTSAEQGELVVLKIAFPPGVMADATLTPVEEDNFEADPIVSVMSDGTVRITGKKVSFSTRCKGARVITVMASTVIMLPNGQPVLGAIKHRVTVGGPTLPEPPGGGDGDDGWVPVPQGQTAGVAEQIEELRKKIEAQETRVAAILDKIIDRLERAEAESAAPAHAPAPVPAPAASAKGPAPAVGVDIAALGPGWVIKECGVPVTPYRLGQSPVQVAVRQPVQAPLRPGNVPSTGGRWNIEGDWNPTYGEVVAHLREPKHAPFSASYEPLTQYSFGQLRWIHDEHHDTLSGPGRAYAVPSQRYVAPIQRPRVFRSRPMSACPGGVCPL